MATLYFKVQADYEKVIRLREEINKLKQELTGMNAAQDSAAFKTLNTRLGEATREFNQMTQSAAQAGASIEGGFKRKIFDASQVVNGLSEKIILQRGTVQQLKNELSGLKEKYREALNGGGDVSGLKANIQAANARLAEQKAVLFDLTQEQANARLSVKKLRDEYALFKQDSGESSEAIGKLTSKMKGWAATIAGGMGIKELIGKIVQVRGEFENIETSIGVLLGGDQGKLQSLMNDLKQYALISPLTTKDMAGALQMMVGFGIQAEDSIKYLKAMGDISMGNTAKFNSLALAFSQMSAAGKLMGQDLNQMINAGFNPLNTISAQTGKSIGTLKDEMSNGAISAKMVQDAFIAATSAGGQFYGMAEEGSKTINGQLSMLEESFDNVFNAIGENSEGLILGAISAATTLVENYETVGKVLAGLVATYGTYRTAVMASVALDSLRAAGISALTTKEIIHYGWLVLVKKAQLALNAAMSANPYVLLATAIVAAGSALWAFANNTTAAEEAQKRLSRSVSQIEGSVSAEMSKLRSLEKQLAEARKGTAEWNSIKQTIVSNYGKYLSGIDAEIEKTGTLTGKYDALSKSIRKAAAIRGFDSVMKGEEDEYNKIRTENLEKIYDGVIKAYGEEQGLKAYRYILAGIDSGKEIPEKIQKILASVSTGWKGGDTANKNMQDIIKQGRIRDDARRKYMNIYGLTDKDIVPGDDGSKGGQPDINYKQAYESARKEWDNAKKELSKIEKDKDKFTSQQYEDARKRVETAEKAYNDLGGVTGGALSKQVSTAQKEAESQKRQQQKLSDDLLAIRRQNQQEEINQMEEGTEKKRKQIDHDYEIQKEEISRKAKELAETNKKAGISDVNAGGLTHEQQTVIDRANELNDDKQKRSEADLLKEEAQAMREYLKEYGTFQQQKLAIAEEYAEKIRNAQSGGERLSLEKERDTALASADTKALKANINWEVVFGEFGGMFSEMIKPALEEAKRYVKTDRFKESDQASQSELISAISQMEESLGGTQSLNFKQLGQDIQAYQHAQAALNAAKQMEIEAIERLAQAQGNYKKALESGTDEEKDAARQALENAKENAEMTSKNVQMQTDSTKDAQNTMNNTARSLSAGMKNVEQGLQKLASGGLRNAYEGTINILRSGNGKFGDAMNKVADKLESVPIVGWILGVVDIFKDGVSNVMEGLIDSVLGAVGNILSDILSGDLAVTIGKSLMNGIGNILDTLTFGGFGSWISSSNAKEVAETTERLTSSNERLKDSVDSLKEEIGKSGGWKAIDTASQAEKDQRQINEQTAKILEAQMAYTGAHHSNAYYWRLSPSDYASLNQSLTGYLKKNPLAETKLDSVGSLQDIYKLTPEQMDYIRTYNVDMWEKMLGTGKYDKSEYWENYADLAGKLEEITASLKETLTQTSFDSLRSSFMDSLLDMDKDAASFSEDFSQYMMKSILNARISDLLDDDLQAFYNKWADYAKSDNEMTKAEQDELKREWEDLAKRGQELRDEVASFTGYDQTNKESTQQEATSKGFATASQESVEELSGRMTAMYESNLRLEVGGQAQTVALTELNSSIMLLVGQTQKGYDVADETRTILANSYLELQGIRENTEAVIKPIKNLSDKLDKWDRKIMGM